MTGRKATAPGRPTRPARRQVRTALGAVAISVLLLAGCGPGTWETRAPASLPRQEVSFSYSPATGRFYLAGGHSTVQEAYDPSTDSWTAVASYPENVDHVAAIEVNGLIYYIGGLRSYPGPAVGSVHIYDPVADQFSAGAPMPTGRERGAGGAAAYDGRIYYAGGLHAGLAVAWFDVYDPATDTWTNLPDMPEARDHFSGAVSHGLFHVIGGRHGSINATTTTHDAFDFASNAWVSGLAPLPTPRGGFGTAVLGNDILVIGGEGAGKTYSKVEAYQTTTDTWATYKPMPTARHGIQAAVCDESVYIAAGGTRQSGGAPTAVNEIFSLAGPSSCGRP